MIRIKCPKCAEVQTLDDDQAGQVGLCEDCGAKFRVPAKKAAAARPAKRSAVEDDEDDDDEETDDEEDAAPKKKSKGKSGASAASGSRLPMSIGIGVAALLLSLGGVFIDMVGLLVAGLSFGLVFVCALLCIKEAYRTPRLLSIALGLVVMGLLAVGAIMVRDQRISAFRQQMKKEIDEKAALAWVSREA
jgi:hypothetical protein